MKTKIIFTSSAIIIGLMGLGLSFLPNEILNHLTIETNQTKTAIMQLLGALYLGFGMMNWMVRGSIIGGIYNKPIVIGNLMHFGVGALTLVKVAFGVQLNTGTIITLTFIYVVFAIAFGYIFMVNPSPSKNN
tara:strand:+ start:3663 stop:4058 length:396 start_codon:yes stop_codon:yes gene_type:complete